MPRKSNKLGACGHCGKEIHKKNVNRYFRDGKLWCSKGHYTAAKPTPEVPAEEETPTESPA